MGETRGPFPWLLIALYTLPVLFILGVVITVEVLT
jgi:hypothetical protein